MTKSLIPTSWKLFNCSSNFYFRNVTCGHVQKTIKILKLENSCGHDGLWAKLLQHASEIISPVLSLLIIQSPQTDIFSIFLKTCNRSSTLIRAMNKFWAITDQYHFYLPYLGSLKIFSLISYTDAFNLMTYSIKSNIDSNKIIPLN